ncbi:MAG: EMC3/TMCO1 family protein, partial [Thermoplasmata archaeon]
MSVPAKKGADDAPLRSEADTSDVETLPPSTDEGDETEEGDEEEEEEDEPKPARPPAPAFKLSTFILVFLFLLGIWMAFDTSTRNSVAGLLNYILAPALGFNGHFLLLTMFLAAVVEMALTAIAYNWATDWVKVAKVQAWSKAFRPLSMKAIRSGKKDRMEAIKPHQQRLTQMSSEVSIAQLKGMAVTWFLVIAIYTWVGLFIAADAITNRVVDVGGAHINLLGSVIGPIPWWF